MVLIFAAPLCAEDYGLEVIGLEPLFAGGIQPFFGTNHSLSFSRQRGSRRAHNDDFEYDFAHRATAGLHYGLPRDIPGDLTLSFFAPLVYRDFRVRTGYGVVGDQVGGLGDLGLFMRGRYLWFVPGDGTERSISLSASVGVELPTGASGLERDGIRIPRELQPGRGAASLTFAHIALFGLGKLGYGGRLDLASVTLVRHNSVGVGGDGYDFGDVFRQEFVFKLRVIQEKPYPGNTMFVGAGLIYEAQGADRDNGRTAHDTGWRQIAIKPWFSWHPRPQDIIQVEAEIALWRDVNGSQLVEGVSFFVSYGRRF
ncbi:MAG: hypothetical protein IT462_03650 [Planctomycetes bacterium]|nr:hypothetical protein [Planctomycetota bacterium]